MSENPVKDAIEALYKPVEKIVQVLAGPAAQEVGLAFRDSVQAWRFKRQVRLFKRVQEICAEAGIKPQAVKLSLLFDIVDKATLEEDDDLQDRWANLLANAADPNNEKMVSTAFPDILRQLSKDEAVFIDTLYAVCLSGHLSIPMKFEEGRYRLLVENTGLLTRERITDRLAPLSLSAVYVDNLKRLGLLQEIPKEPLPGYPSRLRSVEPNKWGLTALGRAFIQACSRPRKEQTDDCIEQTNDKIQRWEY